MALASASSPPTNNNSGPQTPIAAAVTGPAVGQQQRAGSTSRSTPVAAATTAAGGRMPTTSSTAPPPPPRSMFDTTLAPTILPRIESIVELLQRASDDAAARSAGANHKAVREDDDGGAAAAAAATTTEAAAQAAGTSAARTATHADGPSIALGATSDAYDLDDYLSGGDANAASSSSSRLLSADLVSQLVLQGKELRGVYAELERALACDPSLDWELGDETRGMVQWLEDRRDALRRQDEGFSMAASAVLDGR